jgi:fructose-bisphosphate aldolase class I
MQHGLHPIIEPEVDIKLDSEEKNLAENMLKTTLLEHLNKLEPNEKVLLKLTLPTTDNLYKECIDHPNVLRVFALSGGYNRMTANELLAKNEKVVASFSRALTEGLHLTDTEEEFDKKLDDSIESIYLASVSGMYE